MSTATPATEWPGRADPGAGPRHGPAGAAPTVPLLRSSVTAGGGAGPGELAGEPLTGEPAAGEPAAGESAEPFPAQMSTAGALLSGLTTDPRMAWWIQRAIMAAVAGTIVTALADWRLGLTAAAVVASADALYRSRTTAVIPATARVTSAQRWTRWKLTRLSPAGYYSLHARQVPGTRSVIDHIVVGPAGVYAVDSERWDRRLPVRTTQGGHLFHGPFDQTERLDHVRWEAAQASTLIGSALGRPVTVRPAMVIYGPTVPWIVVKINGVDVFRGRRLRRYLRREASTHRAQRLSDRQIELIHAAAAQVLPPVR